MKQKIKGLLSVALCLMLIIQSASINAATKVKINKKTASIYVGETVQLKIKGTKKKVKWKSSNKKVATVTSKGKVRGIKQGKAKIVATVNKKKYSCNVVVNNRTNENGVINNTIKQTDNPSPTTSPQQTIQPTEQPSVISLGGLKAYNYNEEYTLNSGCKITLQGLNYDYISSTGRIYYNLFNDTENTIKSPVFRVFSTNGKVTYFQFFLDYLKPGMKAISNPVLTPIDRTPIILELVEDKEYTEANYKDTLNPNAMHWIINNSNLK